MAKTWNNPEILHISAAARLELEYIKKRMSGEITSLATPWSKYNAAAMGGIEWGSIHTIAGMSGSGKTAILNELETGLFFRNPQEKFAVVSFNFEMASRRLVGRKYSKKLHKTVKQLYSVDLKNPDTNITQEELDMLEQWTSDTLDDFPIYYIDKPQTADGIYLKMKEVHEQTGLPVLGSIDHSILVKNKRGQDDLAALYDLGAMMSEVKKRMPVAFIALSQLNRSIELVDRIEKRDLQFPKKSDIFGADALYQHSDVMMVTHRPEMLGITSYGPTGYPVQGFVYWHFLKLRDGDPFIAQMKNDLAHNRILEV